MATTYDKASLVMIPSGYKDDKLYSIKPTDGSGDFTFSRDGAGASPATRVNASGLIEKGRTNYLKYSQDFSQSDWVKNAGVTTAHGQTDPNGGSTATRLTFASGGNYYFYQPLFGVGAGIYTASIWVKGVSGSGQICFSTGTSVPRTGATINYTTEWQRFEWYANETTSNSGIQFDNYSDGLSQVGADFLIAFAQTENGLVATDYIETTTAAVSAGLLGDMPRLDYSGGATCPSLLLEPSRVNYYTQSEYVSTGSRVILTNNATTSPEGVDNAASVVATSVNGSHEITLSPIISIGNTNTRTFSTFAKYNGNHLILSAAGGVTSWTACVFDLQNGVAKTMQRNGSQSLGTADIEDYGNGWYRCSITYTPYASGGFLHLVSLTDDVDATLSTYGQDYYAGDDVSGIYVYGTQVEIGSYPTSYIPTYGSASTRGQDALSLTDLQGNGILPALNEGTLFLDLEVSGKRDAAASYRHFRLVDNIDSASNRIRIWEGSAGVISSIRVDFSGTNLEHNFNADTPNKLAVSWGAGGTKIFLNGSVTDSTATRLTFASTPKFLTNILSNYRFDQILLFPTELTQAEVETLTTL